MTRRGASEVFWLFAEVNLVELLDVPLFWFCCCSQSGALVGVIGGVCLFDIKLLFAVDWTWGEPREMRTGAQPPTGALLRR